MLSIDEMTTEILMDLFPPDTNSEESFIQWMDGQLKQSDINVIFILSQARSENYSKAYFL